ncbi:ABC transporter substrate-binding protein [Streptomyces xanthophaeus]
MTVRTPALLRRGLAALTALAAISTVSACGDQTKDDRTALPSASAGTGAPLHDRLPEEIRSAGVIRVGSDIAYPPVEFKDAAGKTVGLDVDIARAMGEQLGVEMRFENGTFDTLVTGLRADRFDVVMSAMNDTKNRQEGTDATTGKKIGEGVDFVDYFTAGVSLYARKGDASVTGWPALCGKKVVVQRATVAHDLATAESAKCPAGSPITVEAYDNDLEAQTRLRSGGADAGCSDFPVAAYAVKTSGGGQDFQLVGAQTGAAPYGIAVAKDRTQIRDALAAALDAVIANGRYAQIVAEWGVQDGAVTKATVNGGS